MIGTGMMARALRTETRALQGGVVREGGNGIAQAEAKVQVKLTTLEGGEEVPLFVFGVHAPNDPRGIVRYVR